MASRFEVYPATPELLEEIAGQARPADIAELWASAHVTPLEAIKRAAALSQETWVATCDGWPICAFGVVPVSASTGLGAPWMVGTKRIEWCARGFLRASRGVVEQMLWKWPRLVNYVDSRNRKAILWLQWLGFEIGPAVPWGAEGLPFHPFTRTR